MNQSRLSFCLSVIQQAVNALKILQMGDVLLRENKDGRLTAAMDQTDTGSPLISPTDIKTHLAVLTGFQAMRDCPDAATFDVISTALKAELAPMWAAKQTIDGVLVNISRGAPRQNPNQRV